MCKFRLEKTRQAKPIRLPVSINQSCVDAFLLNCQIKLSELAVDFCSSELISPPQRRPLRIQAERADHTS